MNIVFGCMLLLVIVWLFYQVKEKEKYILKMKEFIDQFNGWTEAYIDYHQYKYLQNQYKDTYWFFWISVIRNKQIVHFLTTYRTLYHHVQNHNQTFLASEMQTCDNLLSNIDGKSLDLEQRHAVLTDEVNNLVIAGAGSGKTLTIAAKVKYLVEKKRIHPNEILLITFTNKAANEMDERIRTKLGINVYPKTFHKLGKQILTSHTKEQKEVLDQTEGMGIIKEYFEREILRYSDRIDELLDFFFHYLKANLQNPTFVHDKDLYKPITHCNRETMKSQYLRKLNQLRKEKITIQNERVDSQVATMIANFLFLHGINYLYKEDYHGIYIKLAQKSYQPAFYLPDEDLYIEYFDMDQQTNTAHYDVNCQRLIHQQNKTTLIELYSYHNQYHQLMARLKLALKKQKVKEKIVDHKNIYETLFVDHHDRQFDEFMKLVYSFITLFKAQNNEINDFSTLQKKIERSKEIVNKEKNKRALHIMKQVYLYYEQQLNKNNKIDFHDMINQAAELVSKNNIDLRYKYILIDEYQDSSVSRFRLIEAIRKECGAKICCVGDDWQSIYRFAGSDISLFTNFESFFGYTKKLKIQQTYRNSQELINIATDFITSNPEQILKQLRSHKHIKDPLILCMYHQNPLTALYASFDHINANSQQGDRVLLLGRTNYDIQPYLDKSSKLRYDVNKNLTYLDYPELSIYFLTIHKAKGLEADHVIILNMKDDIMGFPSKIADDLLLQLLLNQEEIYEYAEERRLCYVALTRTKNRTYLIVKDHDYSVFVQDLVNRQDLPVLKKERVKLIEKEKLCSICYEGYLKEQTGKIKNCTNPKCHYKEKTKMRGDKNDL